MSCMRACAMAGVLVDLFFLINYVDQLQYSNESATVPRSLKL